MTLVSSCMKTKTRLFGLYIYEKWKSGQMHTSLTSRLICATSDRYSADSLSLSLNWTSTSIVTPNRKLLVSGNRIIWSHHKLSNHIITLPRLARVYFKRFYTLVTENLLKTTSTNTETSSSKNQAIQAINPSTHKSTGHSLTSWLHLQQQQQG